MNRTSRPFAGTLPCLFSTLSDKYSEKQLKQCDIKSGQHFRQASGDKVKDRVKLFAKYFTELFSLIDSLNDYSICERHYNQIVNNDSLLEKLKAEDNSSFFEEGQRKKFKVTNNNQTQPLIQETLEKQDQDNTNILLESIDPEFQQVECVNINEYKRKINELESQNKALLSENKTLLFENKALLFENKALLFENKALLSENKALKSGRFDDQKIRIESIIEIARKERKNFYNDIIDLINDKNRFSLDSLLEYSTSQWLFKRNPVIVKFLETLSLNENESQLEGEKLFKCAVAVDTIYGARHLKYVSAINLAASAIKYSLAKSKTIIDIDNHFLSSGGFNKFIQWQEDLAHESTPLPNGLLFLAFDNEQKGQKNYLDRGNNTVIFHTVTSFISFNFDPTNNIQVIEDPWLHQKLNSIQIQELFEITPDMQALLDKEL